MGWVTTEGNQGRGQQRNRRPLHTPRPIPRERPDARNFRRCRPRNKFAQPVRCFVGVLGDLEFLTSAAKSLLAYLSTRESQEKLVTASVGFDLPVFEGLNDFKIYEEEGPPKGTNYNMVPRGDVIASIVGYPAPLKIGTQMFAQATIPKMIAMCTQSGKSIEAAMSWAESEIEGFMRS